MAGDYRDFYQQELRERKQFFYPPFVKNIKITTKHKDVKTAEQAALHLKNLLASIEAKKILLGPEKSLIGKIKNLYLFELWIKLEKSVSVQEQFKVHLMEAIRSLQGDKKFRPVRFLVDVDPY
jgi:primosomal protein N' (replication factor Y)